jgi:ATP synthase F1, delta subunit
MAKLISKVYSDALFEATKALEKTDTVYEEVLDLKNIFKENEDFKKLLNSPKIVKEEKIQSVQAVFADKISKELMGLLTVVIEKGRQAELESIFDEFILQVKEFKNIGTAYVTSAFELSPEKKESIEAKLIETSRYEKMEMHFKTDPSIMGGLVIRINDKVLDSSISKRLYNIKRELLNIRLA